MSMKFDGLSVFVQIVNSRTPAGDTMTMTINGFIEMIHIFLILSGVCPSYDCLLRMHDFEWKKSLFNSKTNIKYESVTPWVSSLVENARRMSVRRSPFTKYSRRKFNVSCCCTDEIWMRANTDSLNTNLSTKRKVNSRRREETNEHIENMQSCRDMRRCVCEREGIFKVDSNGVAYQWWECLELRIKIQKQRDLRCRKMRDVQQVGLNYLYPARSTLEWELSFARISIWKYDVFFSKMYSHFFFSFVYRFALLMRIFVERIVFDLQIDFGGQHSAESDGNWKYCRNNQ